MKRVPAKQEIPRLSSRQLEILACLIDGDHNKTIAHRLGIELVTVKMHVGLLFKKLGVTNRTKAAVLGLRLHDAETMRTRPSQGDAGMPKDRFQLRHYRTDHFEGSPPQPDDAEQYTS
jgi:DNA-binding CsgD family transcriptional regulator